MQVRLVAVTKPVDEKMSAEDLIAYCARVSSPENQPNLDTSGRLLSYCMKHGHFSVFEMADMVLEIETSIAVSMQILRHKSMQVQQFSLRYSKAGLGFEDIEARAQHPKNRQLSVDNLSESVKTDFKHMLEQVQKLSYTMYEAALRMGVAKEVARMLLPTSTTTRLYLKGPVRSWIHYFAQRLAPATQKEHREVAQAAFKIFEEQFPVVAKMTKETYPECFEEP